MVRRLPPRVLPLPTPTVLTNVPPRGGPPVASPVALFALLAITLLFFLGFPTVFAADSLESLIFKEKEEAESWQERGEELPPLFLLGDEKGAAIYSPAVRGEEARLLCEPVPFDELVDLSEGAIGDREVVLNTSLPRVREVLARSCIVRPADALLAVGAGRQTWVEVKDFVVRWDNPLCPEDSPYSLWVSFQGPPPEPPLFYSTDGDLSEAENHYQPVRESAPVPWERRGQVLPQQDLTPALQSTLAKILKYPDDFNVSVASVGAKNCDRLLIFRRRSVSSEDFGLPNEVAVWQKGEELKPLVTEKVDVSKGSGHLALEGLLDYNTDGLIDLWVSGDRDGCSYRALFKGRETGFEAAPFPKKRCRC